MKNLKFLLPLIAVIFAVAGVFAMKANKKTVTNRPNATAFFQFTGTHGQEDDRTQWKQISQSQYDALDCEGDQQGCRLIGDLNTSDSHPVQVYVNNTTDEVPVTGTHVSQVNNAALE